tara:strand:- start:416 stop:802 length:387 start_codon:yes stop_codon:yes gene_type:complete
MITKYLKSDPILDYLYQHSHLTQTQLDTFLIRKQQIDIKLKNQIKLKDGNISTKGAFLRSLQQAKNNINKSIYTILLINYLEIINYNDIQNIEKISQILLEFKQKKSESINKEDIINLLNELSNVISQ